MTESNLHSVVLYKRNLDVAKRKLPNINPFFNRQFNTFSVFLRASQIEEIHAGMSLKIFHCVPGLSLTLLFLGAVGCVKLMIFMECILLYVSIYSFLYIHQHNNQINNSLPHLCQLSLFNLRYSHATCFGPHRATIR
jgi:hypothetical protein